MIRKVALLALPVLLAALVWGVKWRAEHPPPTKEDLELRAFLSQFSSGKVAHYVNPRNANERKFYTASLSKNDLNLLVENFYLSPKTEITTPMAPGDNGVLTITFSHSNDKNARRLISGVQIFVDDRMGKLLEGQRLGEFKGPQMLHLITTKRWIELLLANPRIGPKLRARIKS